MERALSTGALLLVPGSGVYVFLSNALFLSFNSYPSCGACNGDMFLLNYPFPMIDFTGKRIENNVSL